MGRATIIWDGSWEHPNAPDRDDWEAYKIDEELYWDGEHYPPEGETQQYDEESAEEMDWWSDHKQSESDQRVAARKIELAAEMKGWEVEWKNYHAKPWLLKRFFLEVPDAVKQGLYRPPGSKQ